MTDSATSTNDSLENLVAEYESGVENRQSSDVRAWLNARDEIENHWDELTPEQVGRVEDTDLEGTFFAGIARLNRNGALDTSFGGDGMVLSYDFHSDIEAQMRGNNVDRLFLLRQQIDEQRAKTRAL